MPADMNGLETEAVWRAVPAQVGDESVWHAVPVTTHEEDEALWRAVPAQIDEEHVFPDTVDRSELEKTALGELLQNSTLVAAGPLAYVDPEEEEQQQQQPLMSMSDGVTLPLVENTTLVAAAPIAYVQQSASQQLRDTGSSSGECADVSASLTEPCVSWIPGVDQESGELVVEDEDETVWATLEKEMEEKAATTIQAGFRGHLTRQALLQREDAVQLGSSEQSTAPFTGIHHTSEFHDSLPMLLPLAGDLPTHDGSAEQQQQLLACTDVSNHSDDDDEMSCSELLQDKAATKIQATYRGFKTRSDMQKNKTPVMSRVQSAPQILVQDSVEDQSATKIQAGVRGYLTRQRLKKERSPQPPPSPEVEDAVVKIQAGFRGYKARQEVKSMREGKDN